MPHINTVFLHYYKSYIIKLHHLHTHLHKIIRKKFNHILPTKVWRTLITSNRVHMEDTLSALVTLINVTLSLQSQ